MRDVKALPSSPLSRLSKLFAGSIIGCLPLASPVQGQDQSAGTKIATLGLKSMKVERVTTLFAPDDDARARELAELSQRAAAFFERELGLSFEFRLAALRPADWFHPLGAGLPYGIPWCSVAEGLIVVPSSLKEGVLIIGPNEQQDRRRVDFVTLHEFGHLAAKRYLHPASVHEELPIDWFEEMVATYFGYAFVYSIDHQWAEAAKGEWSAFVESYTPRKLSLDWSFMKTLAADELSQTYAWYQNVLNLRVADLYTQQGLAFLRRLKEKLSFPNMDRWTTESVLADLEQIAPGFQKWAARLQKNK